ncbi:MAG: thioredoxin domain-containing protein [Proteobacteria bacterium]|nr:thioredoxin domain-containing protein [Pseudomonadota bacterium]
MSRKSRRNRASPERQGPQVNKARQASRTRRRGILIGIVVAVLLDVVVGTLLYRNDRSPPLQGTAVGNHAPLASAHSPMLGDAGAKVHIVEFIDPACETCAQFFPLVKQLMAENPDRIRLSIRHVAFHGGSDFAVKLLEASRRQDKYLPTLEALLASQAQWAPHHTVQPDLVLQAIAGVGLNVEQLLVDMNAPEVAQRMQQDRNDAMALKVTATPEYFVNGRPLPSFGQQQLQTLVSEALQSAY